MQSSKQVITAEFLKGHAFKTAVTSDKGQFIAIEPPIDVLIPKSYGPFGFSQYDDPGPFYLNLNITDDDAKEGLIAVETYIKEHFDAHPELLDSKKVVFHHVLVPSKKADKPPQVKPRANFKSNKKPLFAHTGFVDPDELKYEPGAYQGHEFKAMLHVKGMLITIDEKGQSKVVPSIELKRVHVYERESAPAKEFSDDEDDE